MSEPGWYPPLGGAHWEQPVEDFPAPEPAPPPKQRRWVVPVALAVGAAGVASAVTLGVVALSPRHEAAPPPPTVTVPVPVPSPTSATPTLPPIDMISKAVQSSMQKHLDSDRDLSGLKVTKVRLVHKSGNEYKGIANVRTSDGVSHEVPVDVTADEDNTMWETPPGAFAFAQEKPPPPVVVPPPPPASAPVENFRICPSGVSGVASDETSCAFADSVRSSWYSNPGPSITAYSPVTHQSYVMHCLSAVTDVWPQARRCVGTNAQGTLLVVYIN